jgi:hypothetical protein
MTISEVIAKFNHLTETFEMDPDLDLLVVDDAEDDSPAKPSEEEDFL